MAALLRPLPDRHRVFVGLSARSTTFIFGVGCRFAVKLAERSDMAGHSRWAKVKHFKGGIDAERALTFAKHFQGDHGFAPFQSQGTDYRLTQWR
jgi:hypothetical protein